MIAKDKTPLAINRTIFGIETNNESKGNYRQNPLSIAPSLELKHNKQEKKEIRKYYQSHHLWN